MPPRPLAARWTAALLLATGGATVQAQSYPTKPVRVVVPFAPGGNVEFVVRSIAPRMSDRLGQQLIIDNRPGAGGAIGTEIVAKAPPDGYTLLFVGSAHVINPAMIKSLPYDTVRDFAPIGIAVEVPTTLVVHPSLPVKSVKELIAFARARPGQLNYATAGRGTNGHLAGELLNSMAGLNLEHIAYKGAAPALIDLLAGHVHMEFTAMPFVVPYVRANRLRMLAQTGERRSPAAPDVPTMQEAGLPGFVVATSYGFLAPANTPRPIIDRVSGALKASIALPEVRSALSNGGADPVGGTPEEFDAFIRSEIPKWIKVAKQAGITPE
jgi:tripartite-type tricarboxylate transporter receptor subunit TctC